MPRQYDYRHRCPYCKRLYAKRKKWVDHIRVCPANICGVRFSLSQEGPYRTCILPPRHDGTHASEE